MTITDGLRIEVRTLYVPEMENGPHVTMVYQVQLDCAPGQETPVGILESSHFQIGEDGDINDVNDPVVNKLYPTIGPNMETFRYNSYRQFSRHSKNCWMEGSLLFRSPSGRQFRARIDRFFFKWKESPIV